MKKTQEKANPPKAFGGLQVGDETVGRMREQTLLRRFFLAAAFALQVSSGDRVVF